MNTTRQREWARRTDRRRRAWSRAKRANKAAKREEPVCDVQLEDLTAPQRALLVAASLRRTRVVLKNMGATQGLVDKGLAAVKNGEVELAEPAYVLAQKQIDRDMDAEQDRWIERDETRERVARLKRELADAEEKLARLEAPDRRRA